MELGFLLPDVAWPDMLSRAATARSKGVQRLWCRGGDSIVLAGALTQAMPDCSVGVFAPSLRERPPVLLAKQLATLQSLSSERITVAFGTAGDLSSVEAALFSAYEPVPPEKLSPRLIVWVPSSDELAAMATLSGDQL